MCNKVGLVRMGGLGVSGSTAALQQPEAATTRTTEMLLPPHISLPHHTTPRFTTTRQEATPLEARRAYLGLGSSGRGSGLLLRGPHHQSAAGLLLALRTRRGGGAQAGEDGGAGGEGHDWRRAGEMARGWEAEPHR